MAKSKTTNEALEVQEIQVETMNIAIVGTSPFIYNAVSVKSQRQLLLGIKRQSKASRTASLKSDPMSEYRASVYRTRTGPTLLTIPCRMFKRAISNVALDVGTGTSKAEIGRLLWVEGEEAPMYGVPEMMMSVMRDAGLSRAPRIRTRAVVPAPWLATFRLQFVTPNLNAKSVGNLIGASGVICGLGDSRPQKGYGSFGQFRIVEASDIEVVKSLSEQSAREAQEAALREPKLWNAETEELYNWFTDEIIRRGQEDLLNDNDEEGGFEDVEEAAE